MNNKPQKEKNQIVRQNLNTLQDEIISRLQGEVEIMNFILDLQKRVRKLEDNQKFMDDQIGCSEGVL